MIESTDKLQKEYHGIIEHISYVNDANGYTVCEVATDDGDYITCTGYMPEINVGERISFSGNWSTHKTYGEQFSIESYSCSMPESEEDILNYLSSKTIRGIGPRTAERIVSRFGTDTFDVIENHPEWLSDIKGITRDKAFEISETFRNSSESRKVLLFCKKYFTSAKSMDIFRKFGNSAVDLIKSNPYVLCGIDGISFEAADKIAFDIGIQYDDPQRIKAAVISTLDNASLNGHTCFPQSSLKSLLFSNFNFDKEKISDTINDLLDQSLIYHFTSDNENYIALKKYFEAEKMICDKLDMLNRNCFPVSTRDSELFLRQLELRFNITYAELQRKAIISTLQSGVVVITGGPGTGKTTIIRAILSIFKEMDYEVCLCAPTGRAAKRLSEATSFEAFTVHRLLEMQYGTLGNEPVFNKNENDRLGFDVVIIDESSMVDSLLFSSLLKAIKPGARIVIVGDSDQLPSVGAGNVLCDIIESGRFPVFFLHEIFRQDENSLIVKNSHLINSGEMPIFDNKKNDFFFVKASSPEECKNYVSDLCLRRLPKAYGKDVFSKIQIISPTHKGLCGTDSINCVLQSLFVPDNGRNGIQKGKNFFRINDRVMQIKNDYGLEWNKTNEAGMGIFNGESGTVVSVDREKISLTVDFDGKIAVYSNDQLDELELAYAITVHKSQGNEYPIVIIPIIDFIPNLFTRNLLYTAITRAKEMIIIVGNSADIEKMIRNNKQNYRLTSLKDLLTSIV